MTSDSMTIGDDSVVSFHYTLRDDAGSVTESSEGASPVVYMHGRNNIVPGLESQIAGKTAGDKFTAVVAPEIFPPACQASELFKRSARVRGSQPPAKRVASKRWPTPTVRSTGPSAGNVAPASHCR